MQQLPTSQADVDPDFLIESVCFDMKSMGKEFDKNDFFRAIDYLLNEQSIVKFDRAGGSAIVATQRGFYLHGY